MCWYKMPLRRWIVPHWGHSSSIHKDPVLNFKWSASVLSTPTEKDIPGHVNLPMCSPKVKWYLKLCLSILHAELRLTTFASPGSLSFTQDTVTDNLFSIYAGVNWETNGSIGTSEFRQSTSLHSNRKQFGNVLSRWGWPTCLTAICPQL